VKRPFPPNRPVTTPAPRALRDLRHLSPARVGLGRTGASLPTEALLEFTLDHARARDAVHATFDATAIAAGLDALGLRTVQVSSLAGSRAEYLKRPDLGRRLDASSHHGLASNPQGSCDVAIVIGDGLSPSAVNAHAVELVRSLVRRLDGIEIGPVVVASGARVALGDEIGALFAARMVAVLIGERPGLSAPDSLGAYLTFAPRIGRSDAERNCVSSIHASGLSYHEAAVRVAWLVHEGLARQLTGVALKDESALRIRLPPESTSRTT
jgi:ethanolamine ammonia-lyase small subunit